ncbi:MAG TPA: acetate--CoA ligase family protein [Thermomicrobiales bacterium]|nr:acetate--CoA ligase family protein [Thermomicrobiales bacterium]
MQQSPAEPATAVTPVAPPALDEDAAFERAMRGLLHPRRIAIIGASPNPGYATTIFRNLVRCGYEGEIIPVNPRYEEVLGARCYPTADAIPGGADLAVIAVPNRLVLDALATCERAGVRAIDIISSGFGEQQDDAAGAERLHAVRDFAHRTGIRVMGPNCLGNISVPNAMCASSGPYPVLRRGPIGIALQSGLLAYSILLPAHDRGMGFSYMVTLGNEADLDVADMIRYYALDDETRVIGCFVEQFRSPERFLAAAELAAERRKPLVILKVGRSDAGRRAALAHTGSLVGADGIADAVMRQHGVTRVYNLDELLETLAIFHARKLPRGTGVASAFVSGGASGLVADLGADVGLDFPPLEPETRARLREVLPPFGTVGNPLDYTGQAAQQPEILEGSLTALADDPSVHTIIYGRAYPTMLDLGEPTGKVLKGLTERYPDKIFVIMALVAGELKRGGRPGVEPTEPVPDLDGIPFLQGTEYGLRAVGALVRYAEFQRAREREARAGHVAHPAAGRARALVRAAGSRPLVEREAKELLALYDIPTTRERLATTAGEAVAAAREIGYPVVLKVESPDLPHKTEAGGVLLGLGDDAAVREGFATILANAKRYKPDAAVQGVLVQEQVGGKGARELILGMSQDPSFGPAIAVGLGGVFVETLRDVALGVPPLTERDARDMLGRLRGKAILDGSGARGAGPADTDALVAILGRFAQLCLDLREEVAEIDINPLLVFEHGRGARVVDCLIVPAHAAQAGAAAVS